MSSPIHQTSDFDGAFRYAPPRVRAQLQQASGYSEPAADEPPSRDDIDDGEGFASRHAAPPLQPWHSLDPDIVPEPPPDLEEHSARRLLLRLCGAAAVAAVVAAAIVALPGAGSLKHENPQDDSASAVIASDAGDQDPSLVASTTQVEQPDEDAGDGREQTPQPDDRTLPTPPAASAAAEVPATEPAPDVASCNLRNSL